MWGGLLGNKRPDRGKKFQGARNFGGELLGEMPKKGWKNYLVVPKSGGNFFGGHNNFLGENFSGKKKKSPGGFSGKILNFRGDFLGGSYTGGRVWGECWEIKDKIGEKNFSGPEIWGGELLGKMQKKGGKTFWGSVGGPVNPNKF